MARILHGSRVRRLALVVLLGLLPSAVAQQASLSFVAGDGPAADLAVLDVPRAGGVIGAFIRAAADPGAGLQARWSDAFGALGTVVVEGEVEARFGDVPAGRAVLEARGVLGPVAARLATGVDGAPPERFSGAGASGTAPYDRGAWWALEADGRLDRTWLASGGAIAWRDATGAWTVDAQFGARARAALRRELDAAAELQVRRSADGTSLGLGVGAVWSPRRAPEVRGTLWFDGSAGAEGLKVLPGAEITGAWRIGADRVDVAVVARPGGPERAPWSLDVEGRRPWGEGEWVWSVQARTGGRAGSAAAAGVRYVVPFDLGSGPTQPR